MECCICNKDIPAVLDAKGNILRDDAHNAQPVSDGQCCATCNMTVVLPARMGLSTPPKEIEEITQAEKDLLKVWESVQLPERIRAEIAPTIDKIRDKKK